jgi:2,3-bisphosphoglycerate-dependent phosphoglycerate mutase
MRLHIYLFRHGESYYNKDKRFTGWTNSTMDKTGWKQVKKLAKKLKNKKFQVAYHSRLIRSKHTLREVLKYHPECKEVIQDDRIIERDYGRLTRKFHKTIIKKYGKKQFNLWHRNYDIPPPGGESIKAVEKRVLSFIKDMIGKMKKEKVNVAVSAHGNSMRPFRKYFEKLTDKQMMRIENPWDDYFEYVINVDKTK